jgi:molybdate transport system substrate-binding protein
MAHTALALVGSISILAIMKNARSNMLLSRRQALAGLTAGIAASGHVDRAYATSGGSLTVFAASSLKTVLDAVVAAWRAETGNDTVIAFASSPALVRQLANGAPAHLFISADSDWMDYAGANRLIRADTRVNLAGNRLVLIAPKGQGKPVELKSGVDLAGHLAGGRLAVGETSSVPVGKYAKASLEALGAWPGVANRLAQAENARAATFLVARGEAPLGIVYRSDATAEPRVDVVATFPADSHPPIVYPAALTEVPHINANAFLAFLKSAKAQALFQAQGFDVAG